MSDFFRIVGERELSGSVEISGSKNAALPILAASLALGGISRLHNVPEISDVEHFGQLLESLGVNIQKEKGNWEISAEKMNSAVECQHFAIGKMRASILLLAPLLVRNGEVKMPFPGGCVLGKRSAESHLRAFTAFGAEILESRDYLHLRLPDGKFRAAKVVLPEISVTATENAIVAAAFAQGESEIRLSAAEPHVQNLCEFLVSAGVHISGMGTHTLKIQGNPLAKNGNISITPDYLEGGTFLLAGLITNSEITIKNIVHHHLDSFLEKLLEAGANFEIDEKNCSITTKKRKSDFMATSIQTGVFPKFPTDLHPQFAVLMTQSMGTSRIFETLFERKFAYLFELEKMGASVELLNPHQFLVHGKKNLVGTTIASQDIRAGAAMLLAALVARGETRITNIHYLDRGYQNLETKLQKIGADISRESL